MRGYWILAIPCLLLAAYCAALAYGPPDAVPGGQALQSLRRANDSRDLALKMMRSSSFGGHGAPVTVGEIMKVHGEPAAARNAGAAQQPARRDKPEPAPEPTLRGDEPMVDPTPTM
jgi:hypothetical protein